MLMLIFVCELGGSGRRPYKYSIYALVVKSHGLYVGIPGNRVMEPCNFNTNFVVFKKK